MTWCFSHGRYYISLFIFYHSDFLRRIGVDVHHTVNDLFFADPFNLVSDSGRGWLEGVLTSQMESFFREGRPAKS